MRGTGLRSGARAGLALALVLLCASAALCQDFRDALASGELAVVVKIMRVDEAGLADCRLEHVLRGSVAAKSLGVRLEGVERDRLPAKGEKKLLIVSAGPSGGPYVLAGGAAGMMNATIANIRSVVVASEVASGGGDSRRSLPEPEPVPAIVLEPPKTVVVADLPPTVVPPPVEPPKTEPPKIEPPPVEPPKTEPPKIEPPPVEPPKTEPPKTEPPKVEPPKTEPPKTEPPKVEPPKTEPPKTEPPKVEPPKTEPPKTEPPKVEPPKTEPPKAPPARPVVTDDFASRSGAAEAVVLADIIEVEPPALLGGRTVLFVEVKEAMKGSLGRGERVRVEVPLPAEGDLAWSPQKGKAVLFVTPKPQSSRWELVHPLYGAAELGSQTAAQDVYGRLAKVTGLSVPEPPNVTTVSVPTTPATTPSTVKTPVELPTEKPPKAEKKALSPFVGVLVIGVLVGIIVAAGAIALRSWRAQKSEEERASGSAVAVAARPVEEEREEAPAPAPAPPATFAPRAAPEATVRIPQATKAVTRSHAPTASVEDTARVSAAAAAQARPTMVKPPPKPYIASSIEDTARIGPGAPAPVSPPPKVSPAASAAALISQKPVARPRGSVEDTVSVPKGAAGGVSYEIAREENVSYGGVIRYMLRVKLGKVPNEAEISTVCGEIAEAYKEAKPHNALNFFFYLPGSDVDWLATGGRAVWAPFGDWERAGEVRTGDYSNNKVVVLAGPEKKETSTGDTDSWLMGLGDK